MNSSYSALNRNKLAFFIIWVVIFFTAVLIGTGVGAGLYMQVAPIVLVLPAIYLLMHPDICVMLFAGLTLLVAGTLKFFWGLGQFQWLLSLLGVALLVYSLFRRVTTPKSDSNPADGIGFLMILWWICLIFTSMANMQEGLDWLVGIRIFLPVFGIFSYLAYCKPKETIFKIIIYFMFLISSIQWIFCLYQKLRVVPMRIAGHYPGSAWDSIVGSFGGEKFGGGESGSLGIYLSMILVLAFALKKYGQLKSQTFFYILFTSLAAMALTESKVIAALIPLGCFLVYRDYVFKRPAMFLGGTLVLGFLMLALLIAYYYMYWQTDNNLGLIDALYARFAYSFDPHFQASTTNLGRVKSLIFWWDKHAILDNPLTLLFGHGLASAVSSSSVIGQGTAVQQFGAMLDVTGASKLLWESGAIGFFAFLLVFVVGFFRARQLKSHPMLPEWHRAAMVGVEASMLIMGFALFYEVTVVGSPPMQFVAMFFLGYVAYWWRETAGAKLV